MNSETDQNTQDGQSLENELEDRNVSAAQEQERHKAEEKAQRENEAAAPKTYSNEIAVLKDQVEILVKQRLKNLDHGKAEAYAARMKGDSSETYFALICDPSVTPRRIISSKFAGVISPGLVKLVANGTIYWPPAKAQRYVFIYENTLGERLMDSVKQAGLDWRHDRAMNVFIKPLVHTLMDMRDADIVHGAINPTNIFLSGGSENERVVLGECLSAPTGFYQPSIFEPVERAQADSIGRGTGTRQDDLYAFGVSLTMLLRSKDPLAGMSDEEIIREKIENGSYAALTGKDRFTGAILELLRGLLYDDRRQRWSLDEVMQWMEGQRLSPKQSSKKPKASRPVHFNGTKYLRPSLLAMDLGKNAGDAVKMIEDGTLDQWIERSLEDKLTIGRMEQALNEARENGRGPGYWDRLLNRVSMALDPKAPIRYKGVSVQPEGFANALSYAFANKQDFAPYVEMINQQLVLSWINFQSDAAVDVGHLIGKHDSARAFLRQTTMGYGIERCIYFLNPESRCLSEYLQDYYVTTPEEWVYALEDIASTKGKKKPDLFIDRHIAAFLSVKDKGVIDPYFAEINASEYHRKVIGNVKVLATIKKRSKLEKLPALAKWISDILPPVYERFHDRDLRATMKERIEKMAEGGDIVKIMTLLDHNDTWQKDFIGFKKALDEYYKITGEYEELQEKMKKPETFGKEAGHEVAAVVSGMLAALVILGFTFMHFTGVNIF